MKNDPNFKEFICENHIKTFFKLNTEKKIVWPCRFKTVAVLRFTQNGLRVTTTRSFVLCSDRFELARRRVATSNTELLISIFFN